MALEIDPFILREGFHIGLIFNQGCLMMRVTTKQQRTKYAPYDFNSGTALAVDTACSDWETPTDSMGREELEPQNKDVIYQIFMGITPSSSRVYYAYPERVDRMNLIAVRSVPGDVGYWDGEDSPYRDPSPETELWVLEDLVPYFKAENHGVTGESTVVSASWYIIPYNYQVVKSEDLIKQFLRGQRKATIRTMGDVNRLIDAPQWIRDNYGQYLVDPKEVLE